MAISLHHHEVYALWKLLGGDCSREYEGASYQIPRSLAEPDNNCLATLLFGITGKKKGKRKVLDSFSVLE